MFIELSKLICNSVLEVQLGKLYFHTKVINKFTSTSTIQAAKLILNGAIQKVGLGFTRFHPFCFTQMFYVRSLQAK